MLMVLPAGTRMFQKMELDILVEKYCEPEVQRALETKITQLATGQSPHSAAALTALMRLLPLRGCRSCQVVES
jgi:hypothetical protein